eukprot:1089639-Rhodomonas_salina.1
MSLWLTTLRLLLPGRRGRGKSTISGYGPEALRLVSLVTVTECMIARSRRPSAGESAASESQSGWISTLALSNRICTSAAASRTT